MTLLEAYRRKLIKALDHLAYSNAKVRTLTASPIAMDEESLETWESFTARFSRVVDLFLTKYVRAKVLENDPGFSGTIRDFVDQGEKLGLLDSADRWMEYRGFRNIIVHEYDEDELEENFHSLREAALHVLGIRELLDAPQP